MASVTTTTATANAPIRSCRPHKAINWRCSDTDFPSSSLNTRRSRIIPSSVYFASRGGAMSPRRSFISTAVVLNAICIFLAIQAHAWPGKLTEEFHHTYPLPADGRVELDNLNGNVHITAWDQNQVKVDAVK